ncbi:DNA-binding protein [Aquimarina longa]|uniref:DNA-binding protein n=1 Tax=Aquimarina longa TaxID=1080221 RepID=UPI000783AFC8|nr:DNA-binding protein [Aquimarina longa]
MKGKFIAFETEAFYRLIDELTTRVVKKVQPIKEEPKIEWVNGAKAKQLLCIKSTGKLNRLVKEKHITAAQHGRTIVYSRKSIMEFLEKSKI